MEMAVGNETVSCVLIGTCFRSHHLNVGAIFGPGGFTIIPSVQCVDPLLFPTRKRKMVLTTVAGRAMQPPVLP